MIVSEDCRLAEQEFLKGWPAYESTQELDELRASEYARLDRLGHTYLDYTGAGLYADRQVREHLALLEFTSSATRIPATRRRSR